MLTPRETTKDKLANTLISKTQTIKWSPPKFVHLVFESPKQMYAHWFWHKCEVYPIACAHGTKIKYISHEVHVPWRGDLV